MNLTFKIFGIDPGTNTGISIYELDENFNILSLETVNVDLNIFVDNDSNGLLKDADRYLALHNLLDDLLTIHKPKAIAIESAFIKKSFMGAGMKVAGYVAIVMLAIKKFDKDIVICKLAPKSVKKFMGDGDANKDKMKEMLGDEVVDLVDMSLQTEHTIDAISIGLILIKIIKTSPYILKSV